MSNVRVNENAKYRFTVDVSKRLAEEIEKMSNQTGRSKADVFRVAIELLSAAREAQESGMNVGAWSETPGQRKERAFVNF